eukprot:7383654-Prymnesium_polylepis.1
MPMLSAIIAPDNAAEVANRIFSLTLLTGIICPVIGDVVDRDGDAKPMLCLATWLNISGSVVLLLTCLFHSVVGLYASTLLLALAVNSGQTILLGLVLTFVQADPKRQGTISAMNVTAMAAGLSFGSVLAGVFPMKSSSDVTIICVHLAISLFGFVVMAVIPRRCYSRRTFVLVSMFDVTFDRIKALSAAIGRLIAQQVQAVRQAGQ